MSVNFKSTFRLLLTFIMLACTIDGFCQSLTDSLQSELKTASHDTAKIKLRALIGEQIPILRLGYWDSLRADAIKWDMKRVAAQSLNNMGYVYDQLGDVQKSLDYYSEGLKLREALGDKFGIAESLNNLAITFERQGDIPRSLEFQFRGLKLQEEINDRPGVSRSLLNIAHIYENQDDIAKALEYYNMSLKIALEINDLTLIGTDYNNIGLVYRIFSNKAGLNEMKADSLSALATGYLNKALDIFLETGDNEGVGTIYQNIGMIYRDRKNGAKALEYFGRSLKVWESIDNKLGMTFILNDIGLLYLDRNELNTARNYIEKALRISRELGYPKEISLCAENLSEVYRKQDRWKDAFLMQQLYQQMKDSTNNVTTRNASMRKQFQYEYDKKEALLKSEQEKERAVAEERARKQKIIISFSIAGLAVVMIFAALIYRSLRVTKKQKQIIEVKNRETEQQKKIIEEKNKDITDSITYAKRIQTAMLPPKEELSNLIPGSFILFKPKDIVSGDFFFFRKLDGKVYVAAADCTGHGVPGALMSMIGTEKLGEAIEASIEPSVILQNLNNGIRTSLHQSDNSGSTRDGMDIALCSVDTINRKIRYAGANRPIWIIRKNMNEIEEISGTKCAIGGYTEADQVFDSHDIQFQEGDIFYVFSDGYADTYSGTDGKKLKSKKFRELLLSFRERSMEEQCILLDQFIESWKAGIDQVDDILVIGVKL